MHRLLCDARLLQLLLVLLVFLQTSFQEVTLERMTTTRATTMMKTPSLEGFLKEEATEAEVVEEVEEMEVEVEEMEVEVEAKRAKEEEEEEMNTTVLVEVVGAEEEGAKVEVEKAAIRLEMSWLTGPSPALHLELLGYLALVRAFYTHQPQKRPSRQ